MEIDVNDANFEKEVIEKSKEMPVVVDFWAQWCGPCIMLKPILEKIAQQDKRFLLAKANIDNAKEKATEYGVMGVPSIKMFKEGKVVDEFVGAMPEQKIKEWLDKNLA
jgi:putative thioredoxin